MPITIVSALARGDVPIATQMRRMFPGSNNESYSKELDDYCMFVCGFRLASRERTGRSHVANPLGLDERLEVEVIAPPEEFFTE